MFILYIIPISLSSENSEKAYTERFDKGELDMVELHRDLRISAEITLFLTPMRDKFVTASFHRER